MHKVAVQSAVVPAAGPLDRTRVARGVDRRGARKPIRSETPFIAPTLRLLLLLRIGFG
jgi:hypothetical protein